MRRCGGVGRSLVVAVALGALSGSGVAAAAAPAGVLEQEWVSFFRSGPVKGIVVIRDGSVDQVLYSLKGIPATGAVRVVASTKACAKAHTEADRVLGWSLGASNPTSVGAGQFHVEIDGVPAGAIRSLRVFRGAGSSDQRACAKSTPWTTESTRAALELENTLISSYLKAPGPRGLISVGVVDEDTIQLRALLLHKDRGSFRLVGSTAPCSQAHASADRVFAASYNVGDTGTHEVGHWMDVIAPTQVAGQEIRSVRLFRGAGTGDQRECRGIIAVLIGL